MSWHINQKGKSFINDLLTLASKYEIKIMTRSHEVFIIDEKDEVVVGDGTLLINYYTDDGYRFVRLLNTNMIESITLVEQETLNSNEDINNDDEH